MRSNFINPLVFLFPKTRHSELAATIQYLKAENEILRARLPDHIRTTRAERRRLLRLGKPLGSKLRQLITFVCYSTFLRWERDAKTKSGNPATPGPGRPRVSKDLVATVLKMATENQWGYPRIHGEIKKLGFKAARATIRNILKEHGLHPRPLRGEERWKDFLKRHGQTLWACDFLSKKIWTRCGLLECYVLFFINVSSRRVHVAGVTLNPNEQWIAQQARTFRMHLDDTGQNKIVLLRDGDKKFTDHVDDTFKRLDITPIELPHYSPDLNAFAERWVKSLKEECLDHFIVFGVGHLDHLTTEYAKFYNTYRPHQGVGNVPLSKIQPPDDPPKASDVRCKEFLGGLLKHYYRESA